MQYIQMDKILPAFYRTNYNGEYRPVYRRLNGILQYNEIKALHYHSCAEIGICLCGKGETFVDDRIYAFSAGDLQFVPPGIPHLSAAAPGVETRWEWISLEPLRILEDAGFRDMRLLQELSENSFAGVFHPEEYPKLTEIIYKIRNQMEQEAPFAQQELVFFVGLLLVECARVGEETKQERKSGNYAGKLKPAIQYIRENYPDKEAMREERIAEVCNMSSSHFRAVFKRETGMSVRDFIIKTRLARAAYLLRSTEKSVLSVAMESGFGQAACFNRSFMREFRQTPTEFRKYARNR